MFSPYIRLDRHGREHHAQSHRRQGPPHVVHRHTQLDPPAPGLVDLVRRRFRHRLFWTAPLRVTDRKKRGRGPTDFTI